MWDSANGSSLLRPILHEQQFIHDDDVRNRNARSLTRSKVTVAYFALALSIFCKSLAFVFAKYAALDTVDAGGVIQILLNPWYWAELAALGAQTLFWVLVLKSQDLNVVYPGMALVYPLNVGWLWYLFDETVTLTHVIGCIIIVVGIIMATTTKRSKTE